MSEWLNRAFSGGVSLSRVDPAGIILMAAAVAVNFAAHPVSRRWPEDRQARICNIIKLGALVLCCAGAALAIL